MVLASWIHVSDLHFGHGAVGHQWNQRRVLSELLADARALVKNAVLRPDFVFLTGDIAYSGGARTPATGSDEYKLASDWIADLQLALEIPPERVFLVPGNHDVDRGADKQVDARRMLQMVRSGGETIDETLHEPRDRERLRGRMARYLAFAQGFGTADDRLHDGLWWRSRVELAEGVSLRLCGLNTAILAADEHDRGKLRVGERQLAELFIPSPDDRELTLVLGHHPATGRWLADEKEVRGQLDRRGAIHLFGHLHVADSEQTKHGWGDGSLRIAAGAAHAEAGAVDAPPVSHGYNFGALVVLASGDLAVRIWPRRWSTTAPRFVVDTENTGDGLDYAEYRLPERYRIQRPAPRSGLHSGVVLGDRFWSEIRFETTRDLGPALMGRPLGPADVAACPMLPETAVLLGDLERAGSARLAGVAGAGKSICMLQAARRLHAEGWRVLRLDDPMTESVPPVDPDRPTLLIVDNAHLARQGFLRRLEEQATATRRVLSAHTMADSKDALPGIIQLDARRAVRVIADGLRAMPEATLAAVRRADDRVGDRPGDERLDDRINHAAQVATFPWQFCFILGGGWRRASALASSARAAGADLVLAAAAIRQLATRDARCARGALSPLLDARMVSSEADAAIVWLVGQRLLLGREDLRCPHQRLSGVLLGRILEGQDQDGRKAVAGMLHAVLEDAAMPLGGIALLLRELSHTGDYGRWQRLVKRQWLDPVQERCWAATTAVEIREACWALSEMHGYMADEMAVLAQQRTVLAGWMAATPEGAGYAIGRVINHVLNQDEALGREIVAEVDPALLARAMSTAGPLHACEIANLITMMRAGQGVAWKAAYMAVIDRPALLLMVSTWPEDAWLSAVAELCALFCYLEPEFGFELIEALIPAIAERMRADPQYAFQELREIVWPALRLFDPLGTCVGKLAPTRRMKQVGRKLCACWSPTGLADKLSQSTKRSFQSAAGVLSFLHKVSPKQFEATVQAINWDLVNVAIGDDWASDIGYARMLLGVAYQHLPAARSAIRALIARNEPRIISLSTTLAAMAPDSARRHVAAGRRVAICHFGHVDWSHGMRLLVDFANREPELVPRLIEPHYEGLAAALSEPSPSFYTEALPFLRVFVHVEPEGLTRVLDRIDVEKAGQGWRNALKMRENNRVRGAKGQTRHVAAFLVHHALGRGDVVGDLARALRREFPKRSVPPAETLDAIDLAELAELIRSTDSAYSTRTAGVAPPRTSRT